MKKFLLTLSAVSCIFLFSCKSTEVNSNQTNQQEAQEIQKASEIRSKRIDEYAQVIIRKGVNIQKGQVLFLNASVENYKFVEKCSEEAYKAGCKKVILTWFDNPISFQQNLYEDEETYCQIPEWTLKRYEYLLETKASYLCLESPTFIEFSDYEKADKASQIYYQNEIYSKYSKAMMNGEGAWTLAAVPNIEWATKLFPGKTETEAYNLLWDYILDACKITADGKSIENWNNHLSNLETISEKLNKMNFKSFKYKNSKGTDFEIQLVKNHKWLCISEKTTANIPFTPNIPSEELYTAPDYRTANGKLVITKPFNLDTIMIEELTLEFKDGKIINFEASNNSKEFEMLLNTDEGSRYLGEMSLVSYYSPISQQNLVYCNTLFDENAACHFAIGFGYPMTIQNGSDMTDKELKANGVNVSKNHFDFMIGSEDLSIIGTTWDGKEIPVFVNGDFAF